MKKSRSHFLASHPSFMSDSKWLKLFKLFDKLQKNFPELANIYFSRIPDNFENEISDCNPAFHKLSHFKLDDIITIDNKHYIRDSAGIGVVGPLAFADIWEISIPIAQREVVYYPAGTQYTNDTIIFPNYETFLNKLNEFGKFPYEVMNQFTQHFQEKKIVSSNKQVISWKFIIFYGYARGNGCIFY